MIKNLPANAGDTRDTGSIPGLGGSPGGRNGQPTLVFLPGESHGQRSLAGYSSWGCKKLDTTEHIAHSLSVFLCTSSNFLNWTPDSLILDCLFFYF